MIKITCETKNEVKYLVEKLGDDIMKFELFISPFEEKVYCCYNCKTILTETQCNWVGLLNLAWMKDILPLCDACFKLYEARTKEYPTKELKHMETTH